MAMLLLLLGVLYATLFLVSFFQVRQGNDEFGFIYSWAFWVGSFVWEDLMVFSAYHLFAVLVTSLMQDLRVGLLMIGVFWAVRSTGETIYFFLQQFHMPQHHPHHLTGHFAQLERVFGKVSDQKGYILMQIFHQSVVMIAVSAVLLLIVKWSTLPAWF